MTDDERKSYSESHIFSSVSHMYAAKLRKITVKVAAFGKIDTCLVGKNNNLA